MSRGVDRLKEFSERHETDIEPFAHWRERWHGMPTATWLYIQSERTLWTVGFYRPDGRWEPESDHESKESAAERVHYLNGGA
jgi:hypothetical protein